jgi:hypothetical protein
MLERMHGKRQRGENPERSSKVRRRELRRALKEERERAFKLEAIPEDAELLFDDITTDAKLRIRKADNNGLIDTITIL